MGLVCRVCGRDNLSNMGSHLRKKHDMSNDDYDDFCNKLDGKPIKKRVNADELEKIVAEQQKIIEELKANGVPEKSGDVGTTSDDSFDEVPDDLGVEKSDDVIVVTVTPPKTEEHPLVAEATVESKPDTNPDEINKNLFNHVERKNPDRPLSEFLREECNNMTEGELINVLRAYFQIGDIPVLQKIKNNESIGYREAEKMAKNSPPKLKTIKSEIAQALEESFGYIVREVRGANPKGGNPKTWYLEHKTYNN